MRPLPPIFNDVDPRLTKALTRTYEELMDRTDRKGPEDFDSHDKYQAWCVECVGLLRVHKLYVDILAGVLTERARGQSNGR